MLDTVTTHPAELFPIYPIMNYHDSTKTPTLTYFGLEECICWDQTIKSNFCNSIKGEKITKQKLQNYEIS